VTHLLRNSFRQSHLLRREQGLSHTGRTSAFGQQRTLNRDNPQDQTSWGLTHMIKARRISSFVCLYLLFNCAIAADVSAPVHVLNICYLPIYAIIEMPFSIGRFEEVCTPLGRFTENDLYYRDLMSALGDLNLGTKRAERINGRKKKSQLVDIRMRIIDESSGKQMLLDKDGNGIWDDKKFALTDRHMARIERVLGGIYDSIQYGTESLERNKFMNANFVNTLLGSAEIGNLVLQRADGSQLLAPKLDDQDSFSEAVVAKNGKYAGWLATYPNNGASFSMHQNLVVMDTNNRIRTFEGGYGIVSAWCFADGDTVLIYRLSDPDNRQPIGFQMRRIADGELLQNFTHYSGDTVDKDTNVETSTPTWARCTLNAKH
jgi:hypothetical protein